MGIRNVVFDMGGVLVYDDFMAFCRGFAPREEDARLLMQEVVGSLEWVELDRGALGVEEAAQKMAARLPEHLKPFARTMVESWHTELDHIPGMEALIRGLKEAGYGVYLLSNTAKTYYGYREGLPAIDCFDGEYISADYLLMKPQREIYDSFCQTFGLAPAECFFVDDRPENIEGAKGAGWQGFVFRQDAAALVRALEEAGVCPGVPKNA